MHLDPRWYQAAWTFAKAGFLQILGGTEYLLFLVCLAIPVRRCCALLPVAAAFTVACSVTLIASAFQVAPSGVWFPPVIASLTAIAIVVHDDRHRLSLRISAIGGSSRSGVGLAFGFALSFSLRQTLQFAGSHAVTSVASFTLGAAVAQLLVLAALVPVLTTLFRIAISERVGVIVVSALVCHTAWHWMVGPRDVPDDDQLAALRSHRGDAVGHGFIVSCCRAPCCWSGWAALLWERSRRVRLMRLAGPLDRGPFS